jgi:rhamnosyltransferase
MPEPDATPRVALVIPTLNGEPLFEQVLEMWRAQTGVGELEICCPDSGSSDGTRDTIRRAGGRLLEIPPAEFNHGETRNRGLAMTQREFVILSVQDALPLSPTTAAELVAPLMDDERVSATFGRQVPRAGCHPVLAARIDSWAGGTELVVQSLDGRDWEQLEPLERLGLIRYDHVIACVRRAAWEQQPLAVASFGEDVEWSSRVIRAGGRIAFVPGAEVQHSHDRSAWDEARRIYCDHRNLRRLVGLVTVPNRRQIAVNVQAARAHYRNLVDAQQGVDSTTRENWQRWADKLALYENWAQYLGAHFGRSPWFRPVDRWLRRGI